MRLIEGRQLVHTAVMQGSKRRRAEEPTTIVSSYGQARALLTDAIASVNRPEPTLRILEAGCGQKWPIAMDGVPRHITGIDFDADAVRIRQQTQGDLDDAIIGDLRTCDIPQAAFDIVYCSFVLEHVEGAHSTLERLVSAARPGGRIIIRIPDGDTVFGFFVRHSPFWTHVAYKRYVEGFRDAGKPGHAPYPTVYEDVVSVRGLRAFARDHDLDVTTDYGSNLYLSHFGPFARVADATLRLIARLSRGRLSATHNDVAFVFERPRAM